MHGVQRAVDGVQPRRLPHDLPHEEVVVLADRPRVGVVDTDRTLQPPVRRVQRVRVVRAAHREAGALELRLEVALAVDADVAAGRVVVVPVERPADPLGEAGRHGHREPAAGTQDAHQLRDRELVGPDVLEHLGRDDAVEGGVGERQRERVGVHRAAGEATDGSSPSATIALDEVPHLVDHLRAVVERDDGRAAPHRLVRVTSAAAPEVEHALARAHLEPVEVDGEHYRAPACSASNAR